MIHLPPGSKLFVFARNFLLLSYCVLIIPAGASSESTDLDIVLPVSNALQPKIQEIYQTPQVNGNALHVNNDDGSRGKNFFFQCFRKSQPKISWLQKSFPCVSCAKIMRSQ